MLAEKPWNLAAVARLFLGVISTFCVGAVLAGLAGSPTISVGQIKNLPGLVDQLRRQSNPVSAFLWQKLSDKERLLLTNNPPQAQDVVQALNKIIDGPGIYDRERFKGVSLRTGTINLVKQNPTGGGLSRLNRLLLEDAYPSELSRILSDFWLIVIVSFFLEVPAVVWIVLFLRQHNVSWGEAFGFRAPDPGRAVAYGVLGGVLFVPAAWGLQMLSSKLMELLHLQAQDQQMVQTMQDPSLNGAEMAFLGVLAVVVAPIVEELLFRGILYPALKQRGWPRVALWGSSALFALAHVNMVTFLPLLVFAVVLVQLYETFQNLLAPIVAHSLFNAANFLALIFQDQISRALHLT